jgi:N-acetyl-alpha-D-glucosaminyl L-malate synthase BshA
VTTLHGTDVNRVGVDPSYRSITRFTVAQAEGITVPSDALRREARTLLEIPPTVPIEVIPNFVDTEHFAPAPVRDRAHLGRHFPETVPGDEDAPVLFHVSNLRAVKRVIDLVEVLARVRKERPARLVLVGDGPERPSVEARAEALGVTGSVALVGRRPEFARDLRHADAFVLTSESESFGVAALEALSSGVPVFGYRVGGLPEVVTADVGQLVPPFDVDALARAVLESLRDPNRHAERSRAARLRALTHFRPEPALEHYETYYHRVLAGPTRTDTP